MTTEHEAQQAALEARQLLAEFLDNIATGLAPNDITGKQMVSITISWRERRRLRRIMRDCSTVAASLRARTA